ncbi:MAG: hypothetical protein IPG45_16650 [Deltaproteobacteria bacterium]|nr:hypothetical protein [Deltaproteobacteria bacterium]
MNPRLILTLSFIGLACAPEAPPAAAPKTPPAAPSSAPASAPASGPQQVLDQMDTRVAVPLLPMMAHHQKQNMRDHLVAVQEIVLAAANDDFTGVEKAVARIGFSDQMGQMCNHMGAGAPGFTEQAIAFHRTADRISAAARDKDRARVLSELGATLQVCTGCHAVWKQQVVDDPTWQALGRSGPPAH